MIDITDNNGMVDGMEILERQWKQKLEEREEKIAELETRNEDNIKTAKLVCAAVAIGGIALGVNAANKGTQKKCKKAYEAGLSDGATLAGLYIDGYKEGQQTLLPPPQPTPVLITK